MCNESRGEGTTTTTTTTPATTRKQKRESITDNLGNKDIRDAACMDGAWERGRQSLRELALRPQANSASTAASAVAVGKQQQQQQQSLGEFLFLFFNRSLLSHSSCSPSSSVSFFSLYMEFGICSLSIICFSFSVLSLSSHFPALASLSFFSSLVYVRLVAWGGTAAVVALAVQWFSASKLKNKKKTNEKRVKESIEKNQTKYIYNRIRRTIAQGSQQKRREPQV